MDNYKYIFPSPKSKECNYVAEKDWAYKEADSS